ncbi:hypothetical protein [Thalassobacillus sp. CUG 92003]|uniref:hypothetical protein n=1 Tax=Thalassobacillus sp. CUG 92003 TaxID=2736641 RepID=UPI0015E7D71A|nr:hypothetical protein [Thalassobacillus sp. CUG 92003]
MVHLIYDCFQWFNYYLTKGIMDRGYDVIGIDPLSTPLSEHLYMYVARNSSFQHFYNQEDMDRHTQSPNIKCTCWMQDQTIYFQSNEEDCQTLQKIALPPLYGEWMPLPSQEYTSLKDALHQLVTSDGSFYVEDFVDQLLANIDKKDFSSPVESTVEQSENEKEMVAKLIDHYHNYSWLLEEHQQNKA